MLGTLGSDTQAPIKVMTVRRVNLLGSILSDWDHAAAESRDTDTYPADAPSC